MRLPTFVPKGLSANVTLKSNSPEIDVNIGGNSSVFTVNVTIQDDGNIDTSLTPRIPSVDGPLPTLLSTSTEPEPTSSVTQTFRSSTSMSINSSGLSTTTIPSTSAFIPSTTSFTTESTSVHFRSLTTVPALMTQVGDGDTLTNTSSGASVPLIIVILRTLFG